MPEQTIQPAPPIVYTVPASPSGWICLSLLLFFLWLRSAWTRHRQPKDEPYQEGPLEGLGGSWDDFKRALGSLGIKEKEALARWNRIDQRLPLAQQVRDALRLS